MDRVYSFNSRELIRDLVGKKETNFEDLDIDGRLILKQIGVCILSRVYQLNIRTPPYATNVSACFIVHSLHYMFRP
jgi:hypothetical protein